MRLGILASKYESDDNPGIISPGTNDPGGMSYGTYQLAINKGSVHAFIDWLVNQRHEFGGVLQIAEPGTRAFNVAWKKLATDYTEEFAKLQDEYVKPIYYDAAVDLICNETGLNVNERSFALQAVLFSRSVQYGPGYMSELFQDAANIAGESLEAISDCNLIYYIYEVLITDEEWTDDNELRPSLYNRFRNEREDALNLLNS